MIAVSLIHHSFLELLFKCVPLFFELSFDFSLFDGYQGVGGVPIGQLDLFDTPIGDAVAVGSDAAVYQLLYFHGYDNFFVVYLTTGDCRG